MINKTKDTNIFTTPSVIQLTQHAHLDNSHCNDQVHIPGVHLKVLPVTYDVTTMSAHRCISGALHIANQKFLHFKRRYHSLYGHIETRVLFRLFLISHILLNMISLRIVYGLQIECYMRIECTQYEAMIVIINQTVSTAGCVLYKLLIQSVSTDSSH